MPTQKNGVGICDPHFTCCGIHTAPRIRMPMTRLSRNSDRSK